MTLSKNIKPITYLKTHASDVLSRVSESHSPMFITHNGEAKMVVQDIQSYQKIQDSLTMLKIAAMGISAITSGEIKPAVKAFTNINRRRRVQKK